VNRHLFRLTFVFALLGCTELSAQEVHLRPAKMVAMPPDTDGNCPSFWLNGRLHLFTSIGRPLQISMADDQFGDWETFEVEVGDLAEQAIWMEAAWADDDGTVFGWYHHEPAELYEDSALTAPKIGAVVSFDGGRTIHDLGFVLESGDPLNAEALNGCFTGGHGDFSVILDHERQYFYFFFTNYGGPEESQGVVVARMAYADRFDPVGKVFKYHQGAWFEAGVGGTMTPIFPAARAWENIDPDSFWGPAIHWNTYLNRYVMLLNHTFGEPGWWQEGVYISYAPDLSRPDTWSSPGRILDADAFPSWGLWYPQVMGLEPGGTDSLAGQTARFYLAGRSRWEIVFYLDEDLLRPTPSPH
jgi:hypothetical protein